MANPEHRPEMDNFDRLTVVLYRSGLSLVALSSLLYALIALADVSLLTALQPWYLPLVGLGAAAASACIHIYDARVRWFIPLMSWIGFSVLGFSSAVDSLWWQEHLQLAALGFFYAGTGMMAFKEYFCFKIPGLPLVPFLFAAVIFLQLAGAYAVANGLLLLASVIFCWLAIAKWRMPLDFDIGDKSRYQV